MKKFTKVKENFKCENCGHSIKGNGYTNHCPKCLYSKHVDNNPGDRACDCKGLMKPIDIEIKGAEYIITHECHVCGHKKKQKTCENDDFDTIIKIQTNNTKRFTRG